MSVASQSEGRVFESMSRQTSVIKTGSDSSTVKHPAIGVNVTGPKRYQLSTGVPCDSRYGTLKNIYCSMDMSAEHRSKFAALH